MADVSGMGKDGGSSRAEVVGGMPGTDGEAAGWDPATCVPR